jgi:hypothetical protein
MTRSQIEASGARLRGRKCARAPATKAQPKGRETIPVASVAGVDGPGGFHGFGQAAANRSEDEGRDVTFGSKSEIGALGWELEATVEMEVGFAEEFGAEAHVFGAFNAPEPEFFLVALKEINGFLELLHGFIKAGSQEIDAEEPGVAGIADADANAVLPGLIALDGAAVIVAN